MSAPVTTAATRARHVVLALGFGLGDDFLAAWHDWRADPQRSERLVYIAIEPAPPGADALPAVLARAWPPLTPDLHRLAFDGGRVELLLAIGTARVWLPLLVAQVDAFDLRRAGSVPDGDARSLGKALARLAAPGATLVCAEAGPAWRAGLAAAGFVVADERTASPVPPLMQARFAPLFEARRAQSRRRVDNATAPHAMVIGAGLAGCAAAAALAAQGWQSTLIERHEHPASEASGNPGGLFHGIVNAQDGMHARFNRAAALAARTAVLAALDDGVPGAASGLLRLETTLGAAQMRAMLAQLRLPPDYVQALDAAEASARAGIPMHSPCWFYPGGGWVQPGGLAQAWLAQAGTRVDTLIGRAVAALRRTDIGWQAFDATGTLIAEAPTVVLANAADAVRLLREAGSPEGPCVADVDWPIDRVRGQISLAPASRLALPHLPIAGSGYLLPEVDGHAMFGATAQTGDDDPSVRDADHSTNIAQLERLIGAPSGLEPADLQGRAAWRSSAADRLPVIGAVPALADAAMRLDQPRFVPRVPGLFVFGALGSRGITWSALGAQVLASWVTGSPAPVDARLLDAIDPARFVSRRARRASRG